jgi:cation:H+ antiporter
VDSSVEILSAFGVPEFIIGATLVAVGTSLPEIATTVIGSFKHEEEIAAGNIIGSNIFNIGMVAGTVSIFAPLPAERATLTYEFPVMIGFALLMIPLLVRRKGLGKVWGIVALSGYAAFVAIYFLR